MCPSLRCPAWLVLLPTFIGCNRGWVETDPSPEIVRAAKRGDLETVKRLVRDTPASLYATDDQGNTAAGWAILNGHNEVAIYLIESGFPINPEPKNEFPLLMECLSRNTPESEEMLRYLLDKGADPNVEYPREGWVALNMAVNNGMQAKVRLLVKRGAKLDSKDRLGLTPIEMAKQRLSEYRDPNFNTPHGELSDPQVRQRAIREWEQMVTLLRSLTSDK